MTGHIKSVYQLAKRPVCLDAYYRSNRLYKKQYKKAMRQDGKRVIKEQSNGG